MAPDFVTSVFVAVVAFLASSCFPRMLAAAGPGQALTAGRVRLDASKVVRGFVCPAPITFGLASDVLLAAVLFDGVTPEGLFSCDSLLG